MSYKELKRATLDFHHLNVLGKGSTGTVYLGYIDDQHVAVKKFTEGALSEFDNELQIMKNLRHQNIITLLGYCKEGEKHLLVYEYMSKKSVKDVNPQEFVFGMKARMRVAIGVAEALKHLKNEIPSIEHMGLKDSAVLLDKEFNAKLSGFGLSRFVDIKENVVPMRVKDSEQTEQICDIYDFGRLLFQLVTGRPNFTKTKAKPGGQLLIPWARELLDRIVDKPDDETYNEFVDPFLQAESVRTTVLSVSWLAKMCTENKTAERPTIDAVLARLKTLALNPLNEKGKSGHGEPTISGNSRDLMALAYGEKLLAKSQITIADEQICAAESSIEASKEFEKAAQSTLAAAETMMIAAQETIKSAENMKVNARESIKDATRMETEALKCIVAAKKIKEAAEKVMLVADARIAVAARTEVRAMKDKDVAAGASSSQVDM